jgi:hypothetical protein
MHELKARFFNVFRAFVCEKKERKKKTKEAMGITVQYSISYINMNIYTHRDSKCYVRKQND